MSKKKVISIVCIVLTVVVASVVLCVSKITQENNVKSMVSVAGETSTDNFSADVALSNDDFGGTTQKNIMIYADNTAAKDILGDVNGDGFITTYDANMVLAYEVTRRRRTNSNRFCNV